MNKYELALVVSAKLEDEARDAVVEKAKGIITRYDGTITEVEDWGKKDWPMRSRRCMKAFTTSSILKLPLPHRQRSKKMSVLWTTC